MMRKRTKIILGCIGVGVVLSISFIIFIFYNVPGTFVKAKVVYGNIGAEVSCTDALLRSPRIMVANNNDYDWEDAVLAINDRYKKRIARIPRYSEHRPIKLKDFADDNGFCFDFSWEKPVTFDIDCSTPSGRQSWVGWFERSHYWEDRFFPDTKTHIYVLYFWWSIIDAEDSDDESEKKIKIQGAVKSVWDYPLRDVVAIVYFYTATGAPYSVYAGHNRTRIWLKPNPIPPYGVASFEETIPYYQNPYRRGVHSAEIDFRILDFRGRCVGYLYRGKKWACQRQCRTW